MSSMRIVLVDPLGDVLFSGESWLASGPPSPVASHAGDEGDDEAEAAPGDEDEDEDEDEDDGPATLRSAESGIFERAKPANGPASNSVKSDERAA